LPARHLPTNQGDGVQGTPHGPVRRTKLNRPRAGRGEPPGSPERRVLGLTPLSGEATLPAD
jgi:hypothetical protein